MKVNIKHKSVDPKDKALLAYHFLADKKAEAPLILDLRGLTMISDFFVICHGTSPTHTRGLADNLLEEMHKRGFRHTGLEGYREQEWILIDYGDVVVHVFSAEQREFYNLERLWGDAPQLSPEEHARKTRVGPGGRDG